jgi:hypothetical protein
MPQNNDPLRIDQVPVSQLLSFVTHDIYGPASMLRTYLQAVAESTDDSELKAMIEDAERLSGQVEGMLRYLRTCLSMGAGSLEVETRPLRLAPFLDQWSRANPAILRQDAVGLTNEVRAVVDERLLAMALEGAAWQMARMGNAQGEVALGVRRLSRDRVDLGLWRPDGALTAPVLVRAVESREDDWHGFLRRLPACGFPLRIALRLVTAGGGEAHVEHETSNLILTFPLRVSAG